jgi:hypothetical protein
MNVSDTRRYPKRSLKPLIIALAMALPASTALAASMDDVVRTRADQNIDQQYGRDSVYAFSPDAKPLKPDQTSSRDTNVFAEAWHKTEGLAAAAWAKTTGFFHEHQTSTVAQVEPQPYGRAGGYVGADRIAVLESATPNQANGTPNEMKAGQAATGNVANTGVRSGVAAGSAESPNSSADSNGRTSGDGFNSAHSAHGQSESSAQTR